MTVILLCCHIYNFTFVYNNINLTFFSQNYRNLKSHISKFDLFLNFQAVPYVLSTMIKIEDWKSICKGSKIFIFQNRPIG